MILPILYPALHKVSTTRYTKTLKLNTPIFQLGNDVSSDSAFCMRIPVGSIGMLSRILDTVGTLTLNVMKMFVEMDTALFVKNEKSTRLKLHRMKLRLTIS